MHGGIFLFAVLAGVVFAQSQAKADVKSSAPAVHYEISGVVVNSVGGDPVARCHLTASLFGRAENGARRFPAPRRQFTSAENSTNCDAQGHFVLPVPSAGSWHLTASARGFVRQAYDEHGMYSSLVVLTAEAPTKSLEFRLSPESSIVGLVLDEAGEPVRMAQVTLHTVPPPAPGGIQPTETSRDVVVTDDRGMYEFAGLAPGDYRVTVHAQPWYAAAARSGGVDRSTPSADPSLDVAYAPTWFPGVADPALAETITVRAGDIRQADFHLVPLPSIHLKVLTPPRVDNGSNLGIAQLAPIVRQVGGDGVGFVQTTTRFDAPGEFDIGGLTPGLYQVHTNGDGQGDHTTLVELSANSARTIDLNSVAPDMARITLRFDGLGDMDTMSGQERNGGVQVTLIDTDSHHASFFSPDNERGFGEGGFGSRRGRDQRDSNADRTIVAPPGRYEVVLRGRTNVFLTGLTATKGVETAGRYVTVGAGESTLTIHVGFGEANLSGFASLDGKPSVGAMVLLVPVTIEDPSSITLLRQDQTNTDGSFDLSNVIPGQYILVAIDHGWGINWGDRSTLRRYLMEGVPVELKSSAIVKQNVTAQAP